MKWSGFILFLSLAAVGCSTGSTERAGSSTQPAVPVQTPSETSPSLPNSDAFDTTLSPRRAGEAISRVCQELGFAPIGQPSNALFGGGGGFPFAADYFSSHAMAQTAMGEQVDVTCRWVRDGQTRVLVKSNLPPAQHARVVEMLRSAMAAAATQPATSKKSE